MIFSIFMENFGILADWRAADDEKVTVLWPDWDKIERVLFTFQQDSVDSVWSQLFENNVSWYYHVTIGYDVDWPITI